MSSRNEENDPTGGSADERSRVDRREVGEAASEDTREEYTSYRETRPEKPEPDDEAVREADLQPGSPEEDDER